MATLGALADAGALVRIEVDLDDEKQTWRCLYGTPEFVAWLQGVLPNLETGVMDAELSPSEQVFALFADFIEGQHFEEDRRFRRLRRTPDLSVWELKTIDVRIFGWFAAMDMFVCAFGDHKERILKLDSVGAYMAKTDYVRAKLDLDEPKFIHFEEYANVLSDAD